MTKEEMLKMNIEELSEETVCFAMVYITKDKQESIASIMNGDANRLLGALSSLKHNILHSKED